MYYYGFDITAFFSVVVNVPDLRIISVCVLVNLKSSLTESEELTN